MSCIDRDMGECAGEVIAYTSRSGCTVSERCERHHRKHEIQMDALERRLQRDFPGYDVPGSSPPDWFDPAYAGESWDEPE